MNTVICTQEEADLVVGGATQLVVLGEPKNTLPEGVYGVTDPAGWVAPKRWVDATGPCPTCDGFGYFLLRDDPAEDQLCPNPDCADGRRRVALAVPCPACDGKGARYERGAERWCSNCDHGSVVFAHATVEVLPVTEKDIHGVPPEAYVYVLTDGRAFLCRGDDEQALALDSPPVPGRDFVVLLDNVEMT